MKKPAYHHYVDTLIELRKRRAAGDASVHIEADYAEQLIDIWKQLTPEERIRIDEEYGAPNP